MKEGFIFINNDIFSTLLAISEDEQVKGLMFQEPPTPIMTFVYAYPKVNKFWMKSTPAPLDLVFCNNNKITQIHKGIPYSTNIIGEDSNSNLVIELPAGSVKSSNIKLNDPVGLIKPTIAELKNLFLKF
jgi:uncharacterized membrane protein (UPF0127 family)